METNGSVGSRDERRQKSHGTYTILMERPQQTDATFANSKHIRDHTTIAFKVLFAFFFSLFFSHSRLAITESSQEQLMEKHRLYYSLYTYRFVFLLKISLIIQFRLITLSLSVRRQRNDEKFVFLILCRHFLILFAAQWFKQLNRKTFSSIGPSYCIIYQVRLLFFSFFFCS